jgi:hypothetical protein
MRRERGQAQLASLVPTVAPPPPEIPPTPESEIEKKVHRLASQLLRLDEMLEAESDRGRLDRLTAGESRLEELWCRSKDIPKAGSQRHRPEKPRSSEPRESRAYKADQSNP